MPVSETHEETLRGYRLAPQQRRLWSLSREVWDISYQTKCAVTIKGCIERSLLETAARKVLARHEILRTTFRCLPGMTIPLQVIQEIDGISWREDDLSGQADQESLIEAFFRADSQSLDFERGPLLSIHLIKRAEDDHVAIIRLPAVCADSLSLQNLVGEL